MALGGREGWTANGPHKESCTSCWLNGSSEGVGKVEYITPLSVIHHS